MNTPLFVVAGRLAAVLRFVWICSVWGAGFCSVHAQVVSTNLPVADAFVRSLDPTHNFGGAGALSVSGLVATNAIGQQQGQLDSFMRFNLTTAVSLFDGNFGAGTWSVTNIRLVVTESGAPNNAVFNRGVGQFEIRWITNDTWIAGTGQPNTPTTDGVTWNDESSLLDPLQDVTLGSFTNVGANGSRSFVLQTRGAFLSDISSADHLVSLFITAPTNSPVGFTFNSVNFTTPSARPFLVLTAASTPIPEPAAAGLILSCLFAFAVRRVRS